MNKCLYKKKRPIIGRRAKDAIPGAVQLFKGKGGIS